MSMLLCKGLGSSHTASCEGFNRTSGSTIVVFYEEREKHFDSEISYPKYNIPIMYFSG